MNIFVQNDSTNGEGDKAQFGMPGAVGPDGLDSIYFHVTGESIPNVMYNLELPISLANFNFSGAAGSDCCFSGLIFGNRGTKGGPDYRSFWIDISIDLSTFELSPAVP